MAEQELHHLPSITASTLGCQGTPQGMRLEKVTISKSLIFGGSAVRGIPVPGLASAEAEMGCWCQVPLSLSRPRWGHLGEGTRFRLEMLDKISLFDIIRNLMARRV